MKTLYLECNMGAAGDMLMAALLELHPDREGFLRRMNALGLSGVVVSAAPAEKCGIRGTHVTVTVHGMEEHEHDHHEHDHKHGHDHDHHEHDHHEHDHHEHDHHEHHHYSYADICGLIDTLALPDAVRANAAAVYRLIGDAESHAHGAPIEQIHFHEVGSLDAVADVVGCCLLLHELEIDAVTVSPVRVGSGFVRCAHGLLPVPAPATAHILRGIPILGGDIQGELCTPTGAALLRQFADRFGSMPPMLVEQIGCGMGTKDFEAANCVRAFLGETDGARDEIVELCCNLDDMTAEEIGAATDLLQKSGALDVFTTPIFMKKNRPATLLTCLCKPEDSDTVTRLLLLHTTTRGVREHRCRRAVLTASLRTVQTAYGEIRVKTSRGYSVEKSKPEYDDVKAAADAHGVPFSVVNWQALLAAAE